jgi:ATP-dependent Clp protease ATP-binding subunit ClpB
LKRYLQRELETRIGRKLIAGEVPDGSLVEVVLRDGALAVEQRTGEVVAG